MYKHSMRIALLAAALHLSPASAEVLGNAACQALVAQGTALVSQGKAAEAWEVYKRAQKEDPAASSPVASMAYLLYLVAEQAPKVKEAELRANAETTAHEALRLDERDPLAKETLRLLQEGENPLHKANAEADKVFGEGETLFHQKRYAEALAKYELAAKLDPLYSIAWVMAGDCFFMQQQWREAEHRFRKATEIEARNSQAWRFLSDALLRQGERRRAEAALYGAIAAHPSQLPNWDKLEALMKAEGLPFKRLALERKAEAQVDPKTGVPHISINQADKISSADGAVWFTLAAAEVAEHKDNPSPFQKQLTAWQFAMSVAANADEKKGELTDPGLIAIQKLAKAGQLEPAILLLMYRESYRPEFEEWKRKHPDGIKSFIATYGLRP